MKCFSCRLSGIWNIVGYLSAVMGLGSTVGLERAGGGYKFVKLIVGLSIRHSITKSVILVYSRKSIAYAFAAASMNSAVGK